jgi:hypothetical protein
MRFLLGLSFVALVACSGDADDTDDTDTTETESPTETDTGSPPDTEPVEISLRATVLDASGATLSSGIRVQYCRGTQCAVSDLNGTRYEFAKLADGPGSFEVLQTEDPPTLMTIFAPLLLAGPDVREVTVTMPAVDNLYTLAASQQREFDGLYLTLGTGDVQAAGPFDPVPTQVAGVKAATPLLIEDGPTGELLGMWYLWPFDAPTSNLPIRFDNPWAVADSATSVWMGDYETSSWIKIDDLVDDGTGKLRPASDAPLTKLTTLIVVRN